MSGKVKGRRGKVLIVAGSAESLMHYETQLTSFQTETALTAETAIDCIDDFEPDVVIIDEKLPSIPGIELAQWIRNDQAAPHYYAILLVASSKNANLEELQAESGADSVCRVEHVRQDLVGRIMLLLQIKALSDKSNSLIMKLSQSKETIRELEDQDSITRLYNLSYINTRFEKEFRHAERFKQPLSVMIMVIDNFRELSHIKGPIFCIKLLQQLGNELLHLTRADDIVGRSWGGEFVMILPETKPDGCDYLRSRILKAVNEHLYGPENDRIAIELSFGYSTVQDQKYPRRSIQEMLLDAEDKLLRYMSEKGEAAPAQKKPASGS